MKIVDNRNPNYTIFEKLENGDCFVYFGKLYIKIGESINNKNAFCVESSDLVFFIPETEVTQVECEIIIIK